jgi:ribosomal protein S6--L-glutamate ligase
MTPARPRLVVLNGEPDWADFFPDAEVIRHRLQDTHFSLRDGVLHALDRDQGGRVDGILWRLGAVRPDVAHLHALHVIALSGVPCVNAPRLLARQYDRLAMLLALRDAGLPVVPFDVVTDAASVPRLRRPPPFVVKLGNHHGGIGKVLVRDDSGWDELCDLLAVSPTYATVEPYYDYRRDVRVLLVGDEMWAMARRGAGWRANVATEAYEVIAVPPALAALASRAAAALGASLLALDILELDDDRVVVLESNETPGFKGFPRSVRETAADLLRRQLPGAASPA